MFGALPIIALNIYAIIDDKLNEKKKKEQEQKKKVEACKICDNRCNYCKFACNCNEEVEID